MAPKPSAYFDALRIPLALLGVFGITYAAYYFLYVTGQQEHLTGRNFRLLATIGEQIDAAIENDHAVFFNLLGVDRENVKTGDAGPTTPPTLEERLGKPALDFIPILRKARLVAPRKDPCVSSHRVTATTPGSASSATPERRGRIR